MTEGSSVPDEWIPNEDGVLPPPGYVLGRVSDGREYWLPPESLRSSSAQSELSDDQIRRIMRFKELLGSNDPTPLDETLNNFRRDQNPESEIQVFERIAQVYEQETADRTEADAVERRLLYRVIVSCSFSTDMDHILARLPAAKGLPDLQRVVERYESA